MRRGAREGVREMIFGFPWLCLIAVSTAPDLSAYLVLLGGILGLLSEVRNAFLELTPSLLAPPPSTK